MSTVQQVAILSRNAEKVKELWETDNIEGLIEWFEEEIGFEDNGTILEMVDELHQEGIYLLHDMCMKGQEIIVEMLITSGCDINVQSPQMTPLQVACQYGHANIVDLLLLRDARILLEKQLAWHESSPFYIASKHGHKDVITRLLGQHASLVKDENVRSCLLYAACLSGNVSVVKIWISPGMDINHPLQLVTSFEDCEKKTPLYAACTSGQIEVVRFLYDFGADLTAFICETFPEIIGELLKDCVACQQAEEDDLFPLHEINLSKKQLGLIHPQWLEPYKITLVDLDISFNMLTKLPRCLPWELQNLQCFKASNNLIKSIEPPENSEEEFCQSLEFMYLNENKLESVCEELFKIASLKELNLSKNQLKYLVRSKHQNMLEPIGGKTRDSSLSTWCSPKLQTLNLSQNQLEMLPEEIQGCTGLVKLLVSHNQLHTFPNPWDCPLASLDLSHNQLVVFPVSVELFWGGTLKNLQINNNLLEEINESIVRLQVLVDLNASKNKIERLPSPDTWDCNQLYMLDLSHNLLGSLNQDLLSPTVRSPFEKLVRRNKKKFSVNFEDRQLSFPKSLSHCLHELNLKDNNLDSVPDGICHLLSLETLNISKNPGIKSLPNELGLLQNCRTLNLEGLQIDGIDTGNKKKTKEILRNLLNKLRKCEPYYKMKMVVLGKKDKGKSSLVNCLREKKQPFPTDQPGIVVDEIKFVSHKKKQKDRKPDVTFSVWDLAGDTVYTSIHQCVLTPNSLYLVVWDTWSILKEMDQLQRIIYNIKATTPSSRIILVGTFLDRLKPQDQGRTIQLIKEKLMSLKPPDLSLDMNPAEELTVHGVSCSTGEGITELKEAIYDIASSLPNPGLKCMSYLGRNIPKSYFITESLIVEEKRRRRENKLAPFLTQEEFNEIISKIPEGQNDIESPEEHMAVAKFLVESGSILHYAHQLGAINNLYFLDPSWLCELLSKIVLHVNKQRRRIGDGKISKDEAEKLYSQDENFPNQYIEQYITLLDRFEVAILVEGGKKLIIPSTLPETYTGDLPHVSDPEQRVCRLYKMEYIPSGIWPRLLARIMVKVEKFSTEKWHFMQTESVRIISFTTGLSSSFGRNIQPARRSSRHGLHLKDCEKAYWQEGIYVRHRDGFFLVEGVHGATEAKSGELNEGILITVVSRNQDFSPMGLIVDEIEDIVHDFYPGLNEPDEYGRRKMYSYAVCPICYPVNGTPPSDLDHFTVDHCARFMLQGISIACRKGVPLPLSRLIPELLMKELPEKFFLDATKLDFDTSSKENFLGGGVTGSVYKGKFGDDNVAIKVYHGDIRNKYGAGHSSVDSGTGSMPSNTSTRSTDDESGGFERDDMYSNISRNTESLDLDEMESMKAYRSLIEMRQEVALTSKLQHPCVISFIGLSFSPKLVMVLELAPWGSLRNILDKENEKRPPFNKYRDKDKTFPPVLDKDLTFKIIFQIAKGLQYLHDNGITYRDLKTDNILVTSRDLDSSVNVKLSDYGISKYCWSGGTMGMVGTPGYQAPEVLDGLAYDEKVDIFSFAMVITEVLSGHRPYESYTNLAQISKAMKISGKRPGLKEYNIESNFPYLEHLMEECWVNSPLNRPSADIIVSLTMRNPRFLCQRAILRPPTGGMHSSECMLNITKSDFPDQTLLWLWENVTDTESNVERKCSVIDAKNSTYRISCRSFYGPSALCMVKVDREVWIGTEEERVEVYSYNNTGLTKTGEKVLDGIPVSMLCQTLKDKNTNMDAVNLFVYIGLSDGKVLRASWKQGKPNDQVKPSSLTFRDSLHTMILLEDREEVWVATENYIEVINTRIFKVESERRISLNKLGHLCDTSDVLIRQMVQINNGVFCLIANSSIVLRLNVETYQCTHMFSLDVLKPTGQVVSKEFHDTRVDSCATAEDKVRAKSVFVGSKMTIYDTNKNPSDNFKQFLQLYDKAAAETKSKNADEEHFKIREDDPEHEEEEDKDGDSLEALVSTHSMKLSRSLDQLSASISSDINVTDRGVRDDHESTDIKVPPPLPKRNSKVAGHVDIPPPLPERSVKRHTLTVKEYYPTVPRPSNASGKIVSELRHHRPPPPVPDNAAKTLLGQDLPPQPPPRNKIRRIPPKPPKSSHNLHNLRPGSTTSLPAFGSQRNSSASIQVTSVAAVNGSLWLGRNLGDICIVSLQDGERNGRSCSFGEVMAVLHDISHKERLQHLPSSMNQNVELAVAGACVVEVIKVDKSVDIVTWEPYNEVDILRVRSYWEQIREEEKKLAKSSEDTSDPVVLSSIGDIDTF
ncbi:hypothetical protein CHS0354_028574 [Potamilus streckersoni]|uniref:non-specific serine/threonine protein kinase n=1 Tax=Potamilus streckersoni TaxID=2493646 RepID=A0AAE0VZP5_9BIVA|nr:hypothetical protein CHS0354_028574 [Potamilus streckersoni]